MTKIGKLHICLGVLGAVLVLGLHSQSIAQGSLRIGGNSANFGKHSLRSGFTPDPKQYPNIVSGGNLNVASMGLGNGCTGYATANPDVILNWSGSGFLRFYFQGQGDTALVINGADGSWHCNDDTAGTNPQVDFADARTGQYDIWIASYESGQNIRGTLYATELRSNSVRP